MINFFVSRNFLKKNYFLQFFFPKKVSKKIFFYFVFYEKNFYVNLLYACIHQTKRRALSRRYV